MISIGVDLSTAKSDASHAVGDRYTDHDGNEWVFVQASAAVTQYDVVAIKSDYEIAPITHALAKKPIEVGFAQFAFTVDHYGWVMTRGRPTITVLVDAGADKPLYTSGTAGALDDATATQMIRGVVLTDTMTATTSGPMEAVATFPHVNWGGQLSEI